MGRPSAADRIADMAIELITQRTRAEAAEAELREAREVIKVMEETAELVAVQRAEVDAKLREYWQAIDDLRASLRIERSKNTAQCREDDRE